MCPKPSCDTGGDEGSRSAASRPSSLISGDGHEGFYSVQTLQFPAQGLDGTAPAAVTPDETDIEMTAGATNASPSTSTSEQANISAVTLPAAHSSTSALALGPRPLPTSRLLNPRTEMHLAYVKVTNRLALCDICDIRNRSVMQKCRECGVTTCKSCHENGKYDSRHRLDGINVDWVEEPRPPVRSRPSRARGGGKSGGSAKNGGQEPKKVRRKQYRTTGHGLVRSRPERIQSEEVVGEAAALHHRPYGSVTFIPVNFPQSQPNVNSHPSTGPEADLRPGPQGQGDQLLPLDSHSQEQGNGRPPARSQAGSGAAPQGQDDQPLPPDSRSQGQGNDQETGQLPAQETFSQARPTSMANVNGSSSHKMPVATNTLKATGRTPLPERRPSSSSTALTRRQPGRARGERSILYTGVNESGTATKAVNPATAASVAAPAPERVIRGVIDSESATQQPPTAATYRNFSAHNAATGESGLSDRYAAMVRQPERHAVRPQAFQRGPRRPDVRQMSADVEMDISQNTPRPVPTPEQTEQTLPESNVRGHAAANSGAMDVDDDNGDTQSPANGSEPSPGVHLHYHVLPRNANGTGQLVPARFGPNSQDPIFAVPTWPASARPRIGEEYPAWQNWASLTQYRPQELERQWEFVVQAEHDWHNHPVIVQERVTNGALAALNVLEVGVTLQAAQRGMPQDSFWEYWIRGKRAELRRRSLGH
ncbi:hypothetical protein F5Y15DRAFT_411466 [Xylariaceae sp. FL0016]|nr:hypothetical protein F5Y15DRAFT_411466 [Xylariaceae sp. FL0016]